jgi:hypothetical protein
MSECQNEDQCDAPTWCKSDGRCRKAAAPEPTTDDPLVREMRQLLASAQSACPEARLLIQMAIDAQQGKPVDMAALQAVPPAQPRRPLMRDKWTEIHKQHCWQCNAERPLGFWEVNIPGNPRERVGEIYAQCSVCGCYSLGHDGKPVEPPGQTAPA